MSCGRDEERGLPPQLCEEAYAVRSRGPLCLIVDSCCDLQRKQARAVNVILHVCLNLTPLAYDKPHKDPIKISPLNMVVMTRSRHRKGADMKFLKALKIVLHCLRVMADLLDWYAGK